MRRAYLAFIAMGIVFLVPAAMAQIVGNVNVEGYVYLDKAPLAGARVSSPGWLGELTTGSDGRWLATVPSGLGAIKVTANTSLGWQTTDYSVGTATSQRAPDINFTSNTWHQTDWSGGPAPNQKTNLSYGWNKFNASSDVNYSFGQVGLWSARVYDDFSIDGAFSTCVSGCTSDSTGRWSVERSGWETQSWSVSLSTSNGTLRVTESRTSGLGAGVLMVFKPLINARFSNSTKFRFKPNSATNLYCVNVGAFNGTRGYTKNLGTRGQEASLPSLGMWHIVDVRSNGTNINISLDGELVEEIVDRNFGNFEQYFEVCGDMANFLATSIDVEFDSVPSVGSLTSSIFDLNSSNTSWEKISWTEIPIRFNVNATQGDPHFVSLSDPSSVVTQTSDYYQSKMLAGTDPSVVIKLLELASANRANLTFKVDSASAASWGITVSKSLDGVNFVAVIAFSNAGFELITNTIELDPRYTYYKFIFHDDYSYVTDAFRLLKAMTLEISSVILQTRTSNDSVVWSGWSGLVNPGFEFNLSGADWNYTNNTADIVASRTMSWRTEGASAFHFTTGNPTSDVNFAQITQEVELNGVDPIIFDALVYTYLQGGGQRQYSAQVLLDNTLKWERAGTQAELRDQVISTAGLTGKHNLTFRVQSGASWCCAAYPNNFSIDNIRLPGIYKNSYGEKISSPPGRYAQYRATLSTLDPSITPVLNDVTLNYVLSIPSTTVSNFTNQTATAGITVTISTNTTTSDSQADLNETVSPTVVVSADGNARLTRPVVVPNSGPGALYDNDAGTSYALNSQSLVVLDLGASITINGIRIQSASSWSYVIQTSTDNANYVSVATGTAAAGTTEINFGSTSARYVRLVAPSDGTTLYEANPLSPYSSSGTVASRVFDSGSSTTSWNLLNFVSSVPSGTNTTLEVRVSNTSFAPDPQTGPQWVQVGAASPAPISLLGQYFQWRATLTTTNATATPALDRVTVDYGNLAVGVLQNQNMTLALNVGQSFIEFVNFTAGNANFSAALNFTANITNFSTTAAQSIRDFFSTRGFFFRDIVWVDDPSSFLAAGTYQAKITLPKTYNMISNCSGTRAAPTCTQITATCASLNPPSPLPCFNTTAAAGKTLVFLPGFSGAGGGDDVTAPAVSIWQPVIDAAFKNVDTIIVAGPASDVGGITDGTNCNSRIDGATASFTGAVTYSAATGNCSGTLTLNSPSGLSDGAHIISLNVSDAAGNVGNATRQIQIDNTPSVVSVNINGELALPRQIYTNNAAGLVNLTLTADATATQCRFSNNGTAWSAFEPTSTTKLYWNITIPTNTSDGIKIVYYQCQDAVGNLGNATDNITLDRTLPFVNITAPANLSYLAGNRTILVNATDVFNISAVEFYIENATGTNMNASCKPTVPAGSVFAVDEPPYPNSDPLWSPPALWNTTLCADGAYKVIAVAYDGYGYQLNTNITAINVTVDNTPPNLTLIRPESRFYNFSTGLPLDYATADNNPGITCAYALDSGAATSLAGCANTTFSAADGPHNTTINVTDAAGNLVTKRINFTVDTVLPSAVVSAPAVITSSGVQPNNITFTVSCSDATSGCNRTNITTTFGSCVVSHTPSYLTDVSVPPGVTFTGNLIFDDFVNNEYQSFSATAASADRVILYIYNVNVASGTVVGDLYVTLETMAGTVFGTTNTLTSVLSGSTVTLDFQSTVALTPGTVYRLKFHATDSEHLGLRSNTNIYDGGVYSKVPATADIAFNLSHIFTSNSCNITLPNCVLVNYTYNITIYDNAANINFTPNLGKFEVRKATGCDCVQNVDCAVGFCVTTPTGDKCILPQPILITPEKPGVIAELGATGPLIFTLENIVPLRDTVELTLSSLSGTFRNWVWFDGHKTDAQRTNTTLTIGPAGGKQAVSVQIFAGQLGNYDFTLRARSLQTGLVSNSTIVVNVVPKGAAAGGVFAARAPDMSWVVFIFMILAAGLVYSGRLSLKQGQN